MRSFKAALFDVDGTILDSLGVWEQIDGIFFAERGLELSPDYGRCIRGLSFRETAEYTKRRWQLSESVESIMAQWRSMCDDAYVNRLLLKPGAAEYLRSLKARGIRLGIATTLPEHLYRPALTRNGIYDLFDAFATTEEGGLSKACGKVYLLCAARLGVAPEDCAVFEDIPEGLEGAHRAGMQAVLVYDRHNRDSFDQAQKMCDKMILSFERSEDGY